MENAVDAIYIAGAVLLLLVALTIGISSFSTQVAQIDEIVEADERVDIVKETTATGEKFVNYISHNDPIRTVGVDTIVNTLYRSYKENYTVYINVNLNKSTLQGYGINVIDTSETEVNGQTLKKSYYAVFKISTEYNLQNAKEKLNKIFYGSSGNNGFYNAIKNKSFKEYIGEVYQDDITATIGAEMTKEQREVSDYNKTKVRIITYVQI